MTEANDGVVQAELRKAEQALLEAEALSQASLYNGAASRAYYVAYHAASALLNRIGVQPRTHRGVYALVGKHLVETGLLGKEHLLQLARLQERRSIADYGIDEDVSAEQLATIVADARSFLQTARALLASLPRSS